MKFKNQAIFVTTAVVALLVTGCATKRDIHELQSEVASLRALTEAADANAQQALASTDALSSELAAVRGAAESADENSAATRRMLEQLNARLEGVTTPLK